MIWIDDNIINHISKLITKFCQKINLLYIKWPVQFPYLNSIKNLLQIIKLHINYCYYKICNVKKIKGLIKKKWE